MITTIVIDGIQWEVEEATLDSAITTNHISGKQTVAFRLVCSRPIETEVRR